MTEQEVNLLQSSQVRVEGQAGQREEEEGADERLETGRHDTATARPD